MISIKSGSISLHILDKRNDIVVRSQPYDISYMTDVKRESIAVSKRIESDGILIASTVRTRTTIN